MKGLKYLIMLMMVATALPSMAEDTTGDAALGQKNGCGGDSTCGECVIQGSGDEMVVSEPGMPVNPDADAGAQ